MKPKSPAIVYITVFPDDKRVIGAVNHHRNKTDARSVVTAEGIRR